MNRLLRALLGAAMITLPVAAAAQTTHALIVAGIGGDPKYTAQFSEWGRAIHDALALRLDGRARVVLLAEKPAIDSRRIAGPSTRERVLSEIGEMTKALRPGDQLLIVLIGHGSPGQGGEPRLNLPGPDLTAGQLAVALEPFRAHRIAIINTTSASGEFIGALSGPNRIVITATKTGYERNETRFAKFLIDALGGDVADTDKDGRLSALEVFQYAARETARSYEEETRLLTEHALLEDDGDRAGSPKPDPLTGIEGRNARAFVLGAAMTTASAEPASTRPATPEVAALVAARDSLERELRELQAKKEAMEAAAYERALEDLMVKLARTSRALREAEGGKP